MTQVGNSDFPVTEISQQHELLVWGFESLGEGGDTCDCWARGSGLWWAVTLTVPSPVAFVEGKTRCAFMPLKGSVIFSQFWNIPELQVPSQGSYDVSEWTCKDQRHSRDIASGALILCLCSSPHSSFVES